MVVFEILSMLLVATFLAGAAAAQAQSRTPRRTRRVIEHAITAHSEFHVPDSGARRRPQRRRRGQPA
jgi:hypothetical protein